jgi:putative Mg2+ transporter-C (MgtC) family protein
MNAWGGSGTGKSGAMPGPALWGAASDTAYALDADVVVRLLVAAVLGGIIGLEREASDQSAGLRTHIALALGAALFGVISTLGFVEFDRPRSESVLQADVTRVASNVAVGVGFLGAGVIFRHRNSIKNLTTAASLWAVAAIGLASGVGDPTTAAVATAILLLSLVLLRPVRSLVRRRWANRSVTVTVNLVEGADPAPVLAAFERGEVESGPVGLRKSGGGLSLSADVTAPPGALLAWMTRLSDLPSVDTIDDD